MEMSNNYDKLIDLLSSPDRSSEKFNKSVSDINIDDKISEYDEKLWIQEASIKEQKKLQEKQELELSQQRKEINETKSEMILVKRWFWALISIFILVFFGWCYETFYRFSEVKIDYIRATEELHNKTNLYELEIRNIKELNNNIKGDFQENIENEVERQLNSKIIEFNFWILDKDK